MGYKSSKTKKVEHQVEQVHNQQYEMEISGQYDKPMDKMNKHLLLLPYHGKKT